MSELASHAASAADLKPSKGLNIALWVSQVLLVLAFLGAGSGKLLGQPEMVALFDAVGIGQWFRYFTGGLEVLSALLVAVPKTRTVGAAILIVVMTGAALAHVLVLHNGPFAPLVLGGLAGFLLWGRRAELSPMLGR